jgi:DNA-binding MarR family transcriptional regulator
MSEQPPSPDEPSISEIQTAILGYHELVVAIAAFRVALHRYWSTIERRSQEQGLTLFQFSILIVLCAGRQGEDQSPYTVGELAAQFAVTHPAMVQVINRMVEHGIVMRIEEGRMARIVMTEQGWRVLYEAMRPPPAGVTPDVRVSLLDALQHLVEVEKAIPFEVAERGYYPPPDIS